MSAETLRRAAALMRQRAEDATPGRWVPFGTSIGSEVDGCTCHGGIAPYGHEQHCGIEGPVVQASEPDITHIASWQPAAAIAVADLLDVWVDHRLLESGGTLPQERAAILTVANAYLGDTDPSG